MDIYEYRMCPACRVQTGFNQELSRSGDEFVCPSNPEHRFRMGDDGFLKSV
ncbi:Uncharacterised protein [uncultured archaeon]|nr:Uncharacterised protein [uncultured archaeon]